MSHCFESCNPNGFILGLYSSNNRRQSSGVPAVTLANYLVNYSYQATRWEVSRQQIKMIGNNLDSPQGKLQAQKSIKVFYEKLIQERNRRRTASD